MKQHIRKLIVFSLAAAMLSSVMGGCSGSEKEESSMQQSSELSATQSSSSSEEEVEPQNILPVKEEVTLTWWAILSGGAGIVENFNDISTYQVLAEQTGVKIDWIHPPAGQEAEKFNLMITSGDLPDLIDGVGGRYAGGLTKAYEEGLIIDLADLQKQYAPNLTKIYETFPNFDRDAKTLDGYYLSTPFFIGGKLGLCQQGMIMRKDWLDDLQLQPPTNIEEWESTLKAFKEEKNATSPAVLPLSSLRNNYWTGAFETSYNYFSVDGQIKYGPYEDGYKDYLSTMAKWYAEGLIDPEFATMTTAMVDAKILNSEAGTWHGSCGSGFLKYLDPLKEMDENADLVAVPYPSDKIIIKSSPINMNTGASITTSCENPEIAMAYLDHIYSIEGNLAFNFGEEGVSYTMENGEPKFTELVTSQFSEVGRKYAKGVYGNGSGIQDTRYLEQFWSMPQQLDAAKVWSENYDTSYETILKGVLTPEEATKIANMETEIKTYVDEMTLKFILGEEPIENFEQYREQLKQMGVEEVIGIRQAAEDRYYEAYPEALEGGESVELIDTLYR